MNKEIKQNDMLLATLANPTAKANDFLNNNVDPLNTQLLDKDFYKSKQVIKDQFTLPDGKFDEKGFDNMYNLALQNYNIISDEKAIQELDKVEYDPFNVMRPKDSKVYNVDIKFSSDRNPFKQLYSRSAINSINNSEFSLREIAQQGKIYDIETNTWEESVNKLGFFDKLFGETLVYAQWDEDGVHIDPINGRAVNHKKGDWKIDPEGNLFLEKLGDREIYGKQVVSISDILTTDGSALNKSLDFLDSDGKEKSVGKVAMKTIAEVAPLLIPGFGTTYGGIRAAIGLASVMPTFFKSFDSFLRGDSVNYGNDPISKAEGWMSKFNQQSSSDEGSEGFWNFEQMSSMVSSIFTQIYEQRAMAGLSKILMRPDKLLDERRQELFLAAKMYSAKNKVDPARATQMILTQSPDLKKAIETQSQLSKALSLGYMALTSTGDIYGEAINSGYDRRTAGFAALLASAGQYGIMMNNPMGDWFLDETTGYHVNVNRGMINSAIKPYFESFKKVFNDSGLSTAAKRNKLAELASQVKGSMHNWFSTGGSNAILRNMATEGMEEVTEQLVLDATKGIVEVMSYLGLASDKGTFRTVERFTSGEAFQEYLANFVGGILGGGLFEIERSKISPWIKNKGKLSPETHKNLVELVASGHKEELIKAVKREAKYLGNNTLSYLQDENTDLYKPSEAVSQADLIADETIKIIEQLDILLNVEGLNLTDEQILQKAIRTELVLQGIEQSKDEDKHYGIEGLIIDDFRNASNEIVKIRSAITELEKQENSAEQIKVEKEKLKIHKDTINSILSGEKTMKYFDQMTSYLDPDIRQIFGSLDKDNYIKAKYKVSYEDLPVDGLGLTQKSATKDWEDFLGSTDVKKKLEIITNQYKELEKTLNPMISDYVDSGYYEVRKQVQQNVLDLQKTIEIFNTSTTPEQRSKAINNFIAINKNLESLGITKVLPYNAYIYDIGEELFNQGLVRKKVLDSNGNISHEKYTDSELNEVKNGKTLRDRIKNTFNDIARNFPFDPINLENIIFNVNSSVEQLNLSIQNNIDLIRKSDPNGERSDEIKSLEEQLISFNIINFEDTEAFIDIKNDYQSKLQEHFEKIGITGDNFIEEGNKKITNYLRLKNMEDIFTDNSLESLIANVNPEIKEISDLSNLEKLSLLENLEKTGLLKEVFLNNLDVPSLENNLKELINALSNSSEINTEFENLFFNMVKTTIDNSLAILSDPEIDNVIKSLSETKDEFSQKVEDIKPNIFKIRNLSFDILLEALNNGYKDKELYLLAKDMFNQEVESLTKIILPGVNNVNSELFVDIVEGKLDPTALSLSIARAYTEGFSEEESLKDIVEDKETFEDDYLFDLMMNHFSIDTTLGTIKNTLDSAAKLINKNKSRLDNISKFLKVSEEGLKANPIYEKLRTFSMIMNSNPNSSINKILDILEREEMSYKAASGVSTYLSDNIRNQDIQQAINLLDMFDTVIHKMSTTSFNGEGITGFIAMRQQFAKLSGITDDVMNLKTIDSDQAEIMSRDIKSIRNKLQFLKDLAYLNGKKIANEYEGIRDQMELVMVTTVWKSMLDIPELTPFMPPNFIEILDSKDDDELKRIKLETAFYDFNKDSKEEALTAIIQTLEKFDYSDITSYTSETSFISDYNKAIYFASVLSIRSEDYVKRNILSLEGKLNKAPFYSQEVGVKTLIAHTINPELFEKIFELKRDDTLTDTTWVTYLLGGTGVGKTTVTVGQYLDILRQSNEKNNIWLAAPSDDQTIKLTKDVKNAITEEHLSINTFSKSKLFAMFGEGIKKIHDKIISDLNNIDNTTKDNYVYVTDEGSIAFNLNESWGEIIEFDKLPNVLVIDEVTHFSKAELQLLNFISKKSYYNDKSNFMKVIGVGDRVQRGYKVYSAKYNQYLDYNVDNLRAVFSPPLNLSVRASNDQKRGNSDLLLGLMNKADKLYEHAEKEADKRGVAANYKELNNKLSEILKDTRNNLGLKYYKTDDTLEGDLVIKNYSELSAFQAIKKSLDKNPELTVGILTSDGKINEELLETLTNVGFSKDAIDKFKIFTPANVQGSEVDYFIFDFNIIEKFDKLIDTLRSFYTYTTRSKIGSVIVDTENNLYNKLNIENAEPSTYSVIYDPLTTSVVQTLKEDRIEKLRSYIKDDMNISGENNFKWRIGKELEKIISGSSEEDEFTSEVTKVPSISPDPSENKFIHTKAETEKTIYPKVGFAQNDFGIMFHTFYNNPNAKVNIDEEGNYVSIEVDRTKLNTDLNGISNVTDPEEIQNILTEWGRLRSELLRKDVKNKSSQAYKNFFNHIFGNELGNVKIKLIRTASIFDKEVNTPLKKFGYIESELIKDGEPFLNIMAELKLNGKTHYITLATMSKFSTIKEKGLANMKVDKGDPEKVRQEIADEIENKLKVLNDSLLLLKNEGKQPFVILEDLPFIKDGKQTINIITSTRLEDNNKQKHYLINLDRDFIGMYHSEIKIFPSTYTGFKKLLDKYTFGESRSEENIKKQFNLFKNKPYIVVSFNNDLEGSSGNKTSAKIIPINAEGRSVDVLIDEVSKIKTALNQELSDYFGKTTGDDYQKLKSNYKVSDAINVKTESLLDRSQILDILIEWGKTPYEDGTLLDLYTKEVEVSAIDGTPLKRKISLLHVLDNFKRSDDDVLSENSKKLLEVINTVKKNITIENNKDLKEKVIQSISQWVGWSWSFHNIFAFQDAVERQKDKDFNRVLQGFMIDESTLVDSNNYNIFKTYGTALINKLRENPNRLFYYSIPIVADGEKNIKVNPLVSGVGGFSSEFFSDKFYINQTPESERGILPLGIYRNLSINNIPKTEINLNEETEQDSEEDNESEEQIDVEEGISITSIFKDSIPSLVTILDNVSPNIKSEWEETLLTLDFKFGLRNKTVRELFTDLATKIAEKNNMLDIISFTETSELESEEDLLYLLNIKEDNDQLELLASKVMEQYKQCK